MEQSNFRNPGKTFRPAPFWSWNGTMEPGEVQRQAQLMHEQGFGGYFMHSRVGLETPYMGEEWMAAIAAGIESARKYDMEAWFYDEDKWPSGFAGGLVPALGDAYRLKGLDTRILSAADVKQAWDAPGPNVKPGALRALYSVTISEDRLIKFARLAEPPVEPVGQYMLCQMCTAPAGQDRYNGESFVDLMDPKVTQAFIECTHEAYKKRFGHLFGPNVPGIFTDEPSIWPLAGSFHTPWTPALPKLFRELWGYDIVDRLPLLYLVGEGSGQVRHDYWATITRLFRDNFTRLYAEWCERNGVMMTGHYLREDNPVNQAMHLGAAMPHYPYMHLPGIDHLGRNIKNPLTLKQVSSVAHQMGRKRVLCEIFGVAGHSMSFADQKWISDFHFALGITFLNQHLTLYSMLGERKRDYPANISWAQPYWPDYHIFNDYAARCSMFLQRGDFRSDILLLHPMGTFWSALPSKCDEANYKEQVDQAQVLGKEFLTVFDSLLANQRDFDLGDEMVMADHARVDGADLVVGRMRYKAVVLPYCTLLAPETEKLLRSFLAVGGKVYVVGEPSLASTLNGAKLVADADALLCSLALDIVPLVSVTCTDGAVATGILCHQREENGRQSYFLANTHLQKSMTVQVKVTARGEVTVLDPTSGNAAVVGLGESSPFMYSAIRVLQKDATGVLLEWQAPPAGSVMFSVGDGPDSFALDLDADAVGGDAAGAAAGAAGAMGAAAVTSRSTWYAGFPDALATEPMQELAGPWQFSRLHPNVMTLDFCRAAIADGPMSEDFQPVPAVREAVLAACGRTNQIQPYRYLTGQSASKPVPVRMQFLFNIEVMPLTLALVLEKPEKVQVMVNGQPATEKANVEWPGDPGFGALNIQDLVKIGGNLIELSFVAAADGADVEEVYLLGDFGVWYRNGKYVIGSEPGYLLPGSWVEQGYPFYSGTMRYRFSVDGNTRWLDLSTAAASLLRVSINNGTTLTLPWRPWVLQIGAYLHSGQNIVDVDVVSSLRNAFGPLHHKQGDLLSVSPPDFRANPAFWTDDYRFAAYGLIGPVKLA